MAFDGSSASDDVGVADWNWTFSYGGTNVSLGGVSPSFKFDRAGVYRVTLTVQDAAGNWAEDSLNVTVRDQTRRRLRGLRRPRGLNRSVRFDGTNSSDDVGIANFSWTVSDGLLEMYFNGQLHVPVPDPRDLQRNAQGGGRDGELALDSLTVRVVDIDPPSRTRRGPDGRAAPARLPGWLRLERRRGHRDMGVELPLQREPRGARGSTSTCTFHLAGTYTVMLYLEDAAGNWAMDNVTVTVRDRTPPVADAGPDIAADQFYEVILDGSNSYDDTGS